MMKVKKEKSQRQNRFDTASSELQPEFVIDLRSELMSDPSLTTEEICGFWIFKAAFLQRFANSTVYMVLFGFVGCLFAVMYAYFQGSITSMEKRFKMPSKNMGIISMGKDLSQMMLSAVLCYYGGKGHRPRWIGFGLFACVVSCLLCMGLHLIYGSGAEALALTLEYGGLSNCTNSNSTCLNLKHHTRELCKLVDQNECQVNEQGNSVAQVVLFIAQYISGIGGALYYTLGVSYFDDNSDKDRTPALLSLSFALGLIGPAIGFTLVSFCLRFYISPFLTPRIDNTDPRWLGAWWTGWILLAIWFFISGVCYSIFPKKLKILTTNVKKDIYKGISVLRNNAKLAENKIPAQCFKGIADSETSFKDMIATLKRIIYNKVFMCNCFASIFNFFGHGPYLMFMSKYIEIQYRQSPSTASMASGAVPLGASISGMLLSGFIISKYKPTARCLAAWNVAVDIMTVALVIYLAFISCGDNEKSTEFNKQNSDLLQTQLCLSGCHCDYVRYSPVCGDNNVTYTSPCHAGCKKQFFGENMKLHGSEALDGPCPVNCFSEFAIFLIVMCCLKFLATSGRLTDVLIYMRSVQEKDKSTAMGFGMTIICLLAFMPNPIFFGWLMDSVCLVWGETCTNKGNCWLYDSVALRYALNFTAALFIAIGGFFDFGVWHYVQDLKIFYDVANEIEMDEIVEPKEEVTVTLLREI